MVQLGWLQAIYLVAKKQIAKFFQIFVKNKFHKLRRRCAKSAQTYLGNTVNNYNVLWSIIFVKSIINFLLLFFLFLSTGLVYAALPVVNFPVINPPSGNILPSLSEGMGFAKKLKQKQQKRELADELEFEEAQIPQIVKTNRILASCEQDWIKSKSSNGSIIVLGMGSVWEVDSFDRINTLIWLPVDDVLLCDEDSLINKSNGERVSVKRLR